jgi:hypothetical protein
MIGCFAPLAAADDDSLKVVLIVEEKQYAAGSAGKLTVHVFDKAKPVDADNAPTVQIGFYPTRQISVSRTATGVYEGTFTLQSSDISSGYARIAATATSGKSGTSDTTYNEASGSAMVYTGSTAPTGLSVETHITAVSSPVVKPGTKVTVQTKVTHNRTAVVPSQMTLKLSYDDPSGSSHDETLTATNPAVGTYECIYTVPELAYDTDLGFEATAEYNQVPASDTTSVGLDFFQVIYHNVSKKVNEAVFDLYVADLSGKPVGGATISMTYYPDDSYSKRRSVDAGVTASSGKARATLTCDNGTRELTVSGYANATGKSQSFSGTIIISQGPKSAPSPSGDDFEAVYVGENMVYEAGQTVSREYVLFNDSKLWTNKEVYCYILSADVSLETFSMYLTSVDARTLTTDSNGGLKLSVPTPSGKETYYSIYFVSATGVHPKPGGYYGSDHDSVDGSLYSEDSDSFMTRKGAVGSTLKVSVGVLKLGSPTEVKTDAASDDPPLAMTGWVPGEVKDLYQDIGTDRNWNAWSQSAVYMTKKGSTYTGSVTVPSFMPSDEKYTVIVVKEGGTMLTDYGTATLKPGQGTAAAKGEIPWLLVAAAVVVIAVVAIAAVFVMRKRRAVQPPMAPYAGYPPAPGAAAGPSTGTGYQPPAPPPGAGPSAPQMPPPNAQPPASARAQEPTGHVVYVPPPAPPAASPPSAYPSEGATPFQQAPPAPYQPAPQPFNAHPQVSASAQPSPIPPPAPSVTGAVAMPNNAICGYCNQWLLQGSPGILCSCGKYYHEPCAHIMVNCSNCGKKL